MITDEFERQYIDALTMQGPATYTSVYAEESEEARRKIANQCDVPYGNHERQRLDVFHGEGEGPSPLILYFHGGYWRGGSKDDRSFLAEHWTRKGVSVALANYRLAPAGRITEMMADAVNAVAFLASHAEDFAIDVARIVVGGNSAGAHLAAVAASRMPVLGACLLSGLYDLRPLIHTSVAETLSLEEDEAVAASPLLGKPFRAPAAVFVGGKDAELFVQQSLLYHTHRRTFCAPSSFRILESENHFSIIRRFAEPKSEIGQAITQMLENAPEQI